LADQIIFLSLKKIPDSTPVDNTDTSSPNPDLPPPLNDDLSF